MITLKSATAFWSPFAKWLVSRPECRSFESDEQQNTAIDTVGDSLVRIPDMLLIAIMIAGSAAVIYVADYLIQGLSHWMPMSEQLTSVAEITGATLLGLAIVVAVLFILRHRAVRLLREHMAKLGIPICLGCGYNLCGLTQPRCPECGRAFTQSLES